MYVRSVNLRGLLSRYRIRRGFVENFRLLLLLFGVEGKEWRQVIGGRCSSRLYPSLTIVN